MSTSNSTAIERSPGARDQQNRISPSADNTFVVTVAMVDGGTRDPLLVGASTLHRRGVDVVEAELCRPAHGRRVFSATFRATDRQAETVLRTFVSQVDVLDAELFRAFDGRESAVAASSPPARLATTQGAVA